MKTSLVSSAALLLFSTTAVANPMMTVQELRGQAFAGPHVKLTYTYNYGATPSGATTHGTSHSPWVSAGSTSRDTGSGLKSLPILQMCDCHVPTGGTLDYQPVSDRGVMNSVTVQVSVPADPAGDDCMAPCQLADAADAGEPNDPVSTGGTTATGGATGSGGVVAVDTLASTAGTTATGGATGTGGVVAVDTLLSTGGAITGGAAGSGGVVAVDTLSSTGGTVTGGAVAPGTPNNTKGGGCAFLAQGTSPALLCLALLGLGMAARRRRR